MLEELKSLQAILAAAGKPPAAGDPPSRTVSVQLSSEGGDSDRVDLPMLPSLELNAAVSQHYEKGTDASSATAAADAAPSQGAATACSHQELKDLCVDHDT